MRTFIQLIRPYQWNKNLFLFAALVFSRHLFEMAYFLPVLAGFFLFSLASSATYLFNDIQDIDSDREHPKKRLRPLASGKISIKTAAVLAVLLGIITLGGSFLLNFSFGIIVCIYTLLNISYSVITKNIVILDVMSIAAGFVLRVMGGAEIIAIPPSNWLIVCTVLLSLFLGFGKRRHEIVMMGEGADSHREVLAHYSIYFLDQMMAVVTASTVMSYLLYTVSEETVKSFGTRHLVWTVPFVLYGIFRYLYLVHQKEEGGDPAKLMFGDWPLLVNIVLWVISCVLIIYVLRI